MVIPIHMSSSEVSADSNSSLWPADKAMQSSPDRKEEWISHRQEVGGGQQPPLVVCRRGAYE